MNEPKDTTLPTKNVAPSITITIQPSNENKMANHLACVFGGQSVRIQKDELNNIWFCAADICGVLDYANPRDALAKHCRKKGVAKRDTLTQGGTQSLTYINESNLYRLIVKSKKPEAEKFETWVFEEVLPAIRQTGTYTVAQPELAEELITGEQLGEIATHIHEASYCFHFNKLASTRFNDYLKFKFNVEKLEHVRASDADRVVAVARMMKESGRQFLSYWKETEELVIKEYICEGVPFTGTLKRLNPEKFRKAIPEPVNWRELALQVEVQEALS